MGLIGPARYRTPRRPGRPRQELKGALPIPQRLQMSTGAVSRSGSREALGEDVYASWFASVEFEHGDAKTAYLSVPTRFLKSWIQGHYRDQLLDLWRAEFKAVGRIDLAVRSATRPKVDVMAEGAVNGHQRQPAMASASPRLQPAPRQQQVSGPLGGSPVDAHYTFESFCEGSANRVRAGRDQDGRRGQPAIALQSAVPSRRRRSRQVASPPCRHSGGKGDRAAAQCRVPDRRAFHVPFRRGDQESVWRRVQGRASARSICC